MNEVEKLVIEPWWIIIFLLCYVIAGFVFTKTDSIFKAGMSLCMLLMLVAHLIHWYYSV